MESRSRASPEQFAALIDYMERHGDMSNPRQGAQGRIKSDRLWLELTELLNCIGSGVIKSLDRWKKVWTDWKTKTKKKGLAIHRAASGTGGGPGSRQTLTALEERVLGVMGLSAVVGQAVIEERGFDDPPSETISVPPHTRDFTDAEDIILNSITTHFIEGTTASTAPSSLPSPSQNLLRYPPPPVSTPPPPPGPAPLPSATSPAASTSQGVPRRRRRVATPSPANSPTASTPRRRRLLQARRLTPFERATSEFVAVEQRRLQLENVRERNNHEREMERLRLESRRIEIEEKRNEILSRLSGIADNLSKILPELRQSESLATTEILEIP